MDEFERGPDEGLDHYGADVDVDDEYADFVADDFWIDRSPGHGAQTTSEDWVRANHAPVSHDGRALTRTTFYAGDVSRRHPGQQHRDPQDRRSWSDLAKWNDGMYSDISRGGRNFQADKRRWLDTFAGMLECTTSQRERAEWIMDRLNMGPFQGARIPAEGVIVGVLSIVIDADVREFQNRAVERDEMQTLLADLDMDRRGLVDVRRLLHKNARELIKPETDSGPDFDPNTITRTDTRPHE